VGGKDKIQQRKTRPRRDIQGILFHKQGPAGLIPEFDKNSHLTSNKAKYSVLMVFNYGWASLFGTPTGFTDSSQLTAVELTLGQDPPSFKHQQVGTC